MGKIYEDTYGEKSFVRKFTTTTPDVELVWHRDKRDRRVRVINGGGWEFQYDNQLPFVMEDGMIFNIKRESFHRVFKGSSDLIIEIIEE